MHYGVTFIKYGRNYKYINNKIKQGKMVIERCVDPQVALESLVTYGDK